jgi:hypothetical protein
VQGTLVSPGSAQGTSHLRPYPHAQQKQPLLSDRARKSQTSRPPARRSLAAWERGCDHAAHEARLVARFQQVRAAVTWSPPMATEEAERAQIEWVLARPIADATRAVGGSRTGPTWSLSAVGTRRRDRCRRYRKAGGGALLGRTPRKRPWKREISLCRAGSWSTATGIRSMDGASHRAGNSGPERGGRRYEPLCNRSGRRVSSPQASPRGASPHRYRFASRAVAVACGRAPATASTRQPATANAHPEEVVATRGAEPVAEIGDNGFGARVYLVSRFQVRASATVRAG